ncbi:hypothetical protein KR009_007629, partial [Drosophila setifemur]
SSPQSALLTLGQAAQEVPQNTKDDAAAGHSQVTTELPDHIKNLITSHINHVLQHTKNKPQEPTTLTGSVDGSSKGGSGSGKPAPVAVPYPDLLPPLAHPGDVPAPAPADRPAAAPALQSGVQPVQVGHPQVRGEGVRVTQHQATGTLLLEGRPVVQNKVVMPPVEQVLHTPADVAEKLGKLQQHVSKVMQQAEHHIPLAVQQAIKQRREQEEQHQEQQQQQESPKDEPTKTGRSLVIPPNVSGIVSQVHAHIPQLIAQHREEIKLGKCSFQCPKESLAICASNGKCVVNFPGQCELSQWNCFNTKNVFHQVHDSQCQKTIQCYQRDMM